RQLVQPRGQSLRNSRSAHGGEALDLRSAEDRDDARNQGDLDALLPLHVVPELVIITVIEEQLRDDEIGARIHFRFKVAPIDVFPAFARDVAFRKAGDSDTKIALFAN